MSTHFKIILLSLVIRLLLTFASTRSEVHYYITPSQNVSCHQDPYLTLSQFAVNSSSYLGHNEINVSIYFVSGSHNLDREISLFDLHSIVMTKAPQENYGNAVIVECSSQGRFNISESTFASIMSLHFIGYEGNRVSQVEQFIIEDSIFIGVEGRLMNLMITISLNNVTSAKIANTSFLSHAYIYNNSNHDVYAMIFANISSFTVTHCVFTDINTGVGGPGVIYASKSAFNFINSIVSNITMASHGGVIYSSGSLFNIINSTFTDNFANPGGIIISDKSSFSISSSAFTDNRGYNYTPV